MENAKSQQELRPNELTEPLKALISSILNSDLRNSEQTAQEMTRLVSENETLFQQYGKFRNIGSGHKLIDVSKVDEYEELQLKIRENLVEIRQKVVRLKNKLPEAAEANELIKEILKKRRSRIRKLLRDKEAIAKYPGITYTFYDPLRYGFVYA